jgi:hypothetical protein
MRFLPLTSILFVLPALLAIAGDPAMAATSCHCDPNGGLLRGGTCRQYICTPVFEFAPGGVKPIRRASDCPRSRVLICDGDKCTLSCAPKAAKK